MDNDSVKPADAVGSSEGLGHTPPAAPTTTEIVHTWQDGREEVRYRRPYNSPEALEMIAQVLDLQRIHGAACPYSFRHVA